MEISGSPGGCTCKPGGCTGSGSLIYSRPSKIGPVLYKNFVRNSFFLPPSYSNHTHNRPQNLTPLPALAKPHIQPSPKTHIPSSPQPSFQKKKKKKKKGIPRRRTPPKKNHRPKSKLGTITGPYLLTPRPPSACTMKSHAKLSLPPPVPISVLPNVPPTISGS